MKFNLIFPPLIPSKNIGLPLSARERLVKAAKIDPGVSPGLSEARSAAIDRVVSDLRYLYPEAFWPLDEHGYPILGVEKRINSECTPVAYRLVKY